MADLGGGFGKLAYYILRNHQDYLRQGGQVMVPVPVCRLIDRPIAS